MSMFDKRAVRTAGRLCAMCMALVMAGCAEDRMLRHAAELDGQGQHEEAVRLLQHGVSEYPDSTALRMGLAKERADALSKMIAEAGELREAGRYDEAIDVLKRAWAFDVGHKRVDAVLDDVRIQRAQEAALKKAQDLRKEGQVDAALRMVRESLKDNPDHAGLQALLRDMEASARQLRVKSGKLGLAENRPISLDFREANLRTVLDVVTRNSGVNFILDKDIRPDIKVTIFLRSAHVEDALDLIVSTNQLIKKVLDEKTVLIYPNTPEKQRELQEQVVKIRYLSNGEVKGAAAFLRSMIKMREPFVDERSNMIALRDTPETIELAEKLLAVYDTPEPEVLLEVEIVEVNETDLTKLGVQFPSSFSLTPLPAVGSSGLTLANLKGLNDSNIGVSNSSLTINMLRQVGDVNILATPRLRAHNREKAKILIGDKVPVITATVGTNGFVSDSVNYQDVGLKLDVEPNVFPDDDVAIKVGLEVSTLGQQVQTTNGTTAYQISTRNAATVLRLHDGETQLLAGLINKQDTNSSNRVPGLGDFPVLGRLFGSHTNSSERTELVLSITPHVLRNGRRPDAAETELWTGTEAYQRLRSPDMASGSADKSASTPAAREAGSSGRGAAGVPTGPQAQEEHPGSMGSTGKLAWAMPGDVKLGTTFELRLNIDGAKNIRAVPLSFQYDRSALEIVDVSRQIAPGEVAGFSRQIDKSAGLVRLNTVFPQGLTGPSLIAVVQARALKAGVSDVVLHSDDEHSNSSAEVGSLSLPDAIKIDVKP